MSEGDIVSLAEAVPEGGILIVDEAYAEFLPEGGDAVSLALAGGPVIVARTFSKAYGMAGLRIGYVVGAGPMFDKATGVWWGDFGLNTAAAVACGPALADRDHVNNYVRTVDDGLAELRAGLSELGCVSWPHRAPFLMTDLGRGPPGGLGALPAQDLRPGRRRLGSPDLSPDLGRPLGAPPGAPRRTPGDPERLTPGARPDRLRWKIRYASHGVHRHPFAQHGEDLSWVAWSWRLG